MFWCLEKLSFISLHNKNLKVAIICSETDPKECHRSKLIGKELLKYGIDINHIIKKIGHFPI